MYDSNFRNRLPDLEKEDISYVIEKNDDGTHCLVIELDPQENPQLRENKGILVDRLLAKSGAYESKDKRY